MNSNQEIDLYVEELDDEIDYSAVAGCVACAFTVASFSCPGGCASTNTTLSTG